VTGGPVNTAELKRMTASGGLSRDDNVWREGMKVWVKAGNVKGLFPEVAASVAKAGTPNDIRPQPTIGGAAVPPTAMPVAVASKADSAGPTSPSVFAKTAEVWGKATTPVKVGVLAGGIVLLLLLVMVPIFVFSSKSSRDSSSKSADGSGSKSSDGAGSRSSDGPVSVTAPHLIKEYEECLFTYFDKEYKGKQLTVTGKISQFGSGNDSLFLSEGSSGRESSEDGVVYCDVTAQIKPQLASLQIGQQVTIRGIGDHIDFEGKAIWLKECTIAANVQQAIPASKLFANCRASRGQIDEKYKNKAIKLKGVIKEFKIDDVFNNNNPVVELQSTTDREEVVVCVFGLKDKGMIEQLKQGDEITLKGTCQGVAWHAVKFADCNLVSFPERLRQGTQEPIGKMGNADELLKRLRIGMSPQEVINILGQPAARTPFGQAEACIFYVSDSDAIFVAFDKQGRLFTMKKQSREK
jgi:hypothetical protein